MDVSKVGADAFEAMGRVKTRLELACGRCLEPYDLPVDATFELRYVPQPVPRTPEQGRRNARSRNDDLTDRLLQRRSPGHR